MRTSVFEDQKNEDKKKDLKKKVVQWTTFLYPFRQWTTFFYPFLIFMFFSFQLDTLMTPIKSWVKLIAFISIRLLSDTWNWQLHVKDRMEPSCWISKNCSLNSGKATKVPTKATSTYARFSRFSMILWDFVLALLIHTNAYKYRSDIHITYNWYRFHVFGCWTVIPRVQA